MDRAALKPAIQLGRVELENPFSWFKSGVITLVSASEPGVCE